MDESSAYFNGKWVASGQLSLPIDDLGFLLGVTVVERMRTFCGSIFRRDQHLYRLRRSLEIVGWDSEKLCSEISATCDQFITRNKSLFQEGDDWGVVVFVTPGKTVDAENPTVCVHGEPLAFYRWSEQYEAGVAGAIVDVRQVSPDCWPPELKCRSRMHYYLADRQAEAKSPGARAILLDQEGYVGEASTANIVAYYRDVGLITPPRNKVLPGVSQQVLFELADTLGLPHQEDDLLPKQLAKADELFLTSSSVCMLPMVRLDGQPIGAGVPGPTFRKLLSAWSVLVEVDIPAQATAFSNRPH